MGSLAFPFLHIQQTPAMSLCLVSYPLLQRGSKTFSFMSREMRSQSYFSTTMVFAVAMTFLTFSERDMISFTAPAICSGESLSTAQPVIGLSGLRFSSKRKSKIGRAHV